VKGKNDISILLLILAIYFENVRSYFSITKITDWKTTNNFLSKEADTFMTIFCLSQLTSSFSPELMRHGCHSNLPRKRRGEDESIPYTLC